MKPWVIIDDYLDWLNTLPEDYKRCYINLGFEKTKDDNGFAWYCLEKNNTFLVDLIGYSEPTEFDEI